MKRLSLLISCLIAVMSVSAQSPQSYVSFSVGGSVPHGDFAGNSKLGNAAFTLPGGGWAIEYNKFWGNFGLASITSMSNFRVDQAALRRAIPEEDAEFRNFNTNKQSQWTSSTVMTGGVYAVRLGKFTPEFRIMWGFVFGHNPDIAFPDDQHLPDYLWKYTNKASKCTATLGGQASTSVRYSISRRWAIRASYSYYYGRTPYKIDGTYALKEGDPQPKSINFTQTVIASDIFVGVAWQFGY